MSKDMVADFITIVRNGVMSSARTVEAPFSTVRLAIARILKEEGFIKDYTVLEDGPVHKSIKVSLKYVQGESVIHEIVRISKPSRRFYTGIDELKPVIGGLGVSILTTSKGILTHKEAKRLHVGGELMCTVW